MCAPFLMYGIYMEYTDLLIEKFVVEPVPEVEITDRLPGLGIPQEFGLLSEMPWITDGLDAEEIAFITTLLDLRGISSSLFGEYLESHHTRSGTVTLSVSGKMRLWAFQKTSFPQDDDSIETEEAIRGTEEFLGLPFITNDIIVSILAEGHRETGELHPAVYLGSLIHLARESGQAIRKSHIYHEVGHYFFEFSSPSGTSRVGMNS